MKYGNLNTIGKISKSKSGCRIIKCKCKCGNIKNFHISNLNSGATKSCGCLKLKRHGLSQSLTGSSWASMLKRCLSKNDKNFSDYGGIGIYVCEFLSESPKSLIDLIGYRKQGTSIDRVNTKLSYTCGKCSQCRKRKQPLNVRWATPVQQARNKTNSRMVVINGISKNASRWCAENKIHPMTFQYRIDNDWLESRLLIPPTK